MHVLLIGATGYIGSAILPVLVEHGHTVTAPVRSAEKAAVVQAAGATGVVADLTDPEVLAGLFREADGAIQVAADEADAAGFDRRIAQAAIDAFAGTDKPYVHSGGVWIWGAGEGIVESDPLDPPAVTAWRPEILALLDESDVRVTVVHPGIVYGHGKGISTLLTDAPRTEDGRLLTIGSGEQRWTTIHVDDLAELYVAALESGSGHGPVFGIADEAPRVIDVSAAAAGDAGVATEDPGATRQRLGEAFAEALLIGQQASNAKARAIGGWKPSRPSLVDSV
jgi:nucleoside-diphosphate-sugar epimerase